MRFLIMVIALGFPLLMLHAGEPLTSDDVAAIRQQFAAASQKVDSQPDIEKLKSTNRLAYEVAWEAAMEKEAPGLLTKYRSVRGPGVQLSDFGFEILTDPERLKLIEARRQVSEDPAVKSARLKRNSAVTEEERKKAEREYRFIQRKRILEGDPQLENLLNRMDGTK